MIGDTCVARCRAPVTRGPPASADSVCGRATRQLSIGDKGHSINYEHLNNYIIPQILGCTKKFYFYYTSDSWSCSILDLNTFLLSRPVVPKFVMLFIISVLHIIQYVYFTTTSRTFRVDA